MPTEVLVMCGACGRPQPARKGPCVACGGVLPEAPLPGAPAPARPFLEVDLGGGRALSGQDGRLTLRTGSSAAPLVVELGNVQEARLRPRPLFEALVPAVLLAVLGVVVPGARPLALLALFLGLLTTAVWRHYALELRLVGGPPAWWRLGSLRRGSRREAHLLAAGSRLTEVLRARGRGPGVPRA